MPNGHKETVVRDANITLTTKFIRTISPRNIMTLPIHAQNHNSGVPLEIILHSNCRFL